MFYSERQNRLMELLQKEKSMSVHKLAKLLCISESSIRRDLTVLEELGRVRRTFGGAVLNETSQREVPWMYRRTQNMRQKQLIAQKAVSYVRDGMLIFLDASSTAAQLIPLLEDFHELTVVTNSPLACIELAQRRIKNYCTGGRMLNNSQAFVGSGAIRYLEDLQADAVFFSCRGLSEDGVLSDSLDEEVELRRAMLAHGKKKIFLCDSSKVGRSYPYRLCSLEDVDIRISELPD